MDGAQINGVHDSRDDLGPSIYVLLWVTVVYSETSFRDQVAAFLASLLDPQPCGTMGGYDKVNFLQGKTFLKKSPFLIDLPSTCLSVTWLDWLRFGMRFRL